MELKGLEVSSCAQGRLWPDRVDALACLSLAGCMHYFDDFVMYGLKCVSIHLWKKKKNIQSNLVNLKSWGLEVLFRSIENSNYREVDINKYNSQKDYYPFFSLSNICFWCVEKTSPEDVSFTHPKHVLLKTIIEKRS